MNEYAIKISKFVIFLKVYIFYFTTSFIQQVLHDD